MALQLSELGDSRFTKKGRWNYHTFLFTLFIFAVIAIMIALLSAIWMMGVKGTTALIILLLHPRSEDALDNIYQVAFDAPQHRGLRILKVATKVRRGDGVLWEALAYKYANLEQWTSARNAMRRAMMVGREHSKSNMEFIVLTYTAERKWEVATDTARKFIEQEPSRALCKLLLFAARRCGKVRQAITFMQARHSKLTSLSLYSSRWSKYCEPYEVLICQAFLSIGDIMAARRLLGRLRAIVKDTPIGIDSKSAMYTIGAVHYISGEYMKAVTCFRQKQYLPIMAHAPTLAFAASAIIEGKSSEAIKILENAAKMVTYTRPSLVCEPLYPDCKFWLSEIPRLARGAKDYQELFRLCQLLKSAYW